MYLERLKRALRVEGRLRLTFSSGNTEKSIELGREAVDQILKALQIPVAEAVREEPLAITVLGHQVMQAGEAKGLLLRTKESGDVVFALPEAVLQRLTADLLHLASSPISQTLGSGGGLGYSRGKIGTRHP